MLDLFANHPTDACSNRLPVRWHEQSIVVNDAVMIPPPYGVDDCQAAAKDASALQRVKKVVRRCI